MKSVKSLIAVLALVLSIAGVSACSEAQSVLNSDDPLAEAQNRAVCAALDRPLTMLDENIDKIVQSETGRTVAQALQSAGQSLETAANSATGQLAGELTGLDQTLQALLVAWRNDAPRAELNSLADAVRQDVSSVRQTCRR